MVEWLFVIKIIVIVILGYLLGSINTSIIVGKIYGIDIRKHGSGNAGATNALRTLGWKAAVLTGLGDILKAVIACLIGSYLIEWEQNLRLGAMVAGLAVILGHNWPAFFGFRGGKGVFSSIAVIFMVDPVMGLILFGIFIIIVTITRYVSLGSVLGAVSFPILVLITNRSPIFMVFSLALALIIITKHLPNIKRLITGTELKIGEKVKVDDVDKNKDIEKKDIEENEVVDRKTEKVDLEKNANNEIKSEAEVEEENKKQDSSSLENNESGIEKGKTKKEQIKKDSKKVKRNKDKN